MTTSIMAAQTFSRSKKENFLKDFSEDSFRDDVIRPLFYRLGYGDGRDLCGPFEKGKDVIFTEKDIIGSTILVAVQTKKGNLNMSNKVSQNVVTASTQLETALKTNIPMLQTKKKHYPNKIFLCVSGKINENAKHHILDEVKDPRISFLDSDDLIPLIDEHFFEFWLGIDTDILPYFRSIKELVEDKAVSSAEGNVFHGDILMGAASDQSFISLNLYKTTVKQKKSTWSI